MAPRKNVDKTTSVAEDEEKKAPRKRGRKLNPEKPKLKTPTIIKLKLPSIKTTEADNPTSPSLLSPTKTTVSRKVNCTANIKVDMANEVALKQLVKPCDLPQPSVDKPRRPRQRRLAKIILESVSDTGTVVKKRLVRAKPPSDKMTLTKQNENDTNKIKESVSSTDTVVKKRLVKAKPPSNKMTLTKQNENDTKESVSDTAKVVKKRLVRAKPPSNKMTLTKQNENDTNKIKESVPDDDAVVKKKVMRAKPPSDKNENDTGKIKAPNKRKADSTSGLMLTPQPTVKTKAPLKRKMPAPSDSAPRPKRKYTRKLKIVAVDQKAKIESSPPVLNKVEEMKEIQTPGSVDSRKTSTVSSDRESWTREISSSSTTTCRTVSSNDIVRIDKKMPVLRLTNIGNLIKTNTVVLSEQYSVGEEEKTSAAVEETPSSSASSSSESSSSSEDSDSNEPTTLNPQTPDGSILQNDLNLSTSSSKSNESKRIYILEKLASRLQNVDMEFINWMGHKDDEPTPTEQQIKNKIFTFLKEECEVIKLCESIKRHLKSDYVNSYSPKQISANQMVEIPDKPAFLKPDSIDSKIVSDKSEDDDFTTRSSRYVMLPQTNEDSENPLQESGGRESSPEYNDIAYDKSKFAAFEPSYDDDDALSLFAESITGIESSRINSSRASLCVEHSDYEEYIPEPVTKTSPMRETITYCPTKIDGPTQIGGKYKTICKKQNADSTSIHKTDTAVKIVENAATKNVVPAPFNGTPTYQATSAVLAHKSPVFMAKIYPRPSALKNNVFKGVCFFNLISNCKQARCKFLHNSLSNSEVKNRLQRMNDTTLVSEYMLTRSYPMLRRMFGLCFVEEAAKRLLTRILLEMTMDFTTKVNYKSPEDHRLQRVVSEICLLHLNKVDLSTCDDLLQCRVGDSILCDCLIETLAQAQNLSQFKTVFVKLTHYMVEIDRKFRVDVAEHILERVSILPSELSLVLAVLKIIENTDDVIFSNPMMSQFEKTLSGFDKDLFAQLVVQKQRAISRRTALARFPASPRPEIDPHHERERYTSPDTTKMDNLNKTIDEHTTIKRTIKAPPMFNGTSNVTHDGGAKFRPQGHNMRWRHDFRGHDGNRWRTPPHFRPRPPMHAPMRPPMRRHVSYGPQPMYPRMPGPDYF